MTQTSTIQGFINPTNTTLGYAATYAGIIKTSYLEAGSGSPVVLIHGGGSGAIALLTVISQLASWFYVIAPDVPGYGESDKPLAVYNRQFFSSWLQDFMDALGMQKCNLVGHSLGGAIALQFTIDNPDRVERLVLVSTAGFGFALPVIPLVLGIWLYSIPSTTVSQRLHSLLVYDPNCLDQSLIDYSVDVCRKPGGRRAFWHGLNKALGPIPLHQLKRITHPTLIVWGADDRVFPPAHGAIGLQGIPHSQFVLIPKAGHIPFYDQPEAFNDLLVKFLR